MSRLKLILIGNKFSKLIENSEVKIKKHLVNGVKMPFKRCKVK